MRERGQYQLQLLKTRSSSGVGSKINLVFDRDSLRISNAEMGDMIGKIDLDGAKLEDVVADWMKSNESRWKAWIK